jgi:hypothetical protein
MLSTGSLENCFLYLSASAVDFSRKITDFCIEYRKSGDALHGWIFAARIGGRNVFEVPPAD